MHILLLYSAIQSVYLPQAELHWHLSTRTRPTVRPHPHRVWSTYRLVTVQAEVTEVRGFGSGISRVLQIPWLWSFVLYFFWQMQCFTVFWDPYCYFKAIYLAFYFGYFHSFRVEHLTWGRRTTWKLQLFKYIIFKYMKTPGKESFQRKLTIGIF